MKNHWAFFLLRTADSMIVHGKMYRIFDYLYDYMIMCYENHDQSMITFRCEDVAIPV